MQVLNEDNGRSAAYLEGRRNVSNVPFHNAPNRRQGFVLTPWGSSSPPLEKTTSSFYLRDSFLKSSAWENTICMMLVTASVFFGSLVELGTFFFVVVMKNE